MSSRVLVTTLLLAAVLLAVVRPVAATADGCLFAIDALGADTDLRIALDQIRARPVLTAALVEPLEMPGLVATTLKLEEAIKVHARVFGAGDVANAALMLSGGDETASVHVNANGRAYRVRVIGNQIVDADGRTVAVTPEIGTPTSFLVRAGAAITRAPDGTPHIAPGAILEWSLDVSQPLVLRLARSARFARTAASGPGAQVALVEQERAVPGSTLRIRLPGATAQPPASVQICFQLRTEHASQDNTPPRRSREAIAIASVVPASGADPEYEVTVPEQLGFAQDKFSLSEIWHESGHALHVRALAMRDGEIVVDARGEFKLGSVRLGYWAAGGFLALFVVVSGLLGRWSEASSIFNPLHVVRGHSGRLSLSNFQTVMWTVIVLFGLVFVWVTTGKLLSLSEGVLALLGIAGSTSVLARATSMSRDATAAAQRGPATPSSPVRARDKLPSDGLADLVRSDGQIDVLRFQMLGFTLAVGGYVFVNVIRYAQIPEIPDSLYWLMGISNTAYLGGKYQPGGAARGGVDAADRPPEAADSPVTADQINQVQSALALPITGRCDDATVAAVTRFQIEHGMAPVNGVLTQAVAEKVLAEAAKR